MAEGAAAVNETSDSTLSSSNEVGKLFLQFFGQLLTIIGFAAKNASKGKSHGDIDPIMIALVFMIALYNLVLVIVTMLQFQLKSFLPFMMVILGGVVSSLALMMISPTIAGIHLGLWFLIFALMGYKYRIELYRMILQRMNNVFEDQTQSGNSDIPVVESGSFRSRENLNV